MPKNIDVHELITVLSNPADETFPHQRRIALMTFGAYLHFPEYNAMVVRAQCFAACAVVRALHRKKLAPYNGTVAENIGLIAQQYMSPVDISDLLLDHEDDDELSFCTSYEGNQADMSTAEAIAAFLLTCPAERQPSLNKALFFIEHDGFGIDVPKSKQRYWKTSRTTAKKAWTRYGSVSPFLLAQTEMDVTFDCPPDALGVLGLVDGELAHRRFHEFFPGARFFHKRLRETLGKGSKVILRSHGFPKGIKEIELRLPVFTGRQIKLLDEYQAPSPYSLPQTNSSKDG